MKRKITLILSILLALVLLGLLWYKLPVKLTSVSPEDVSELYVFSGANGKELHITEQDEIAHIVNNLSSIKLQKNGISMFLKGYHLNLTIYLKDGSTAPGMNNFIINGPVIRKDPFFYRVVEGELDYSYIEDLMKNHAQDSRGVQVPQAAEVPETAPQSDGIPFRYLHRGFTAIRLEDRESFEQFSSIGLKVILTEEDWSDYMGRFCPGIPYFDSSDFSKECLLASVNFGARPAYVQPHTIKKLSVEDGCFAFEFADDPTECLALNTNDTTHFYVEVLIINREDLPANFEELVYHR